MSNVNSSHVTYGRMGSWDGSLLVKTSGGTEVADGKEPHRLRGDWSSVAASPPPSRAAVSRPWPCVKSANFFGTFLRRWGRLCCPSAHASGACCILLCFSTWTGGSFLFMPLYEMSPGSAFFCFC